MQGSTASSPWYLRYVMVMAFLTITVSLMDRYVVSILMEQIKLDLELTDTQLGLLVGPAFVIVHILSQLPLARLADRSSRRVMISLAMGAWSLFTMAAAFTRTFPQLFITRMGVGITEAACSPALASMLSDYFPPNRRGRALSMLSIGGTAGIGAGMLLGGIVGQAYGWRTALIVAGLPGVLLAGLFFLTVREPSRGAFDLPGSSSGQQQPLGTVLRILAGNRSFRWLVLGASLAIITGIGRGAWEPVFLMRVYEIEQARAGITYFLVSPVPSMLGAFLGGILLDRLLTRDTRWYFWLPAVALLASLPPMLAFLLWPTDQFLVPGVLQAGLAFSILGSIIAGVVGPVIIATGQGLVNASMRAMTHAIWTMAANLIGMGIGPVAVGWLSETLAPEYGVDSIRYALAVISLTAVPAALVLALGARCVREDLQLQEAAGDSAPGRMA